MTTDLDTVRPDQRTNAANELAEATILSLALTQPRAWPSIRMALRPADIWRGDHGLLFAAMLAADEANQPVTPATVYAQLALSKRHDMLAAVTRLLEFPAVNDTEHLDWCLGEVRELAKHRRQAMIAARMQDVVTDASQTPEQITDALARLSVEMELAVEEPGHARPVPGLQTWDDFFLGSTPREDWIVPKLLDRLECVLVLSGSGIGKSWLSRQVALNVAAGLHPFRPGVRIPAKRCLVADMENPASTVKRQTEGLFLHVQRMAGGETPDDRAHLWLYPDGLNIRKHSDAALFERVIAETRPDLVFISSLYNVFHRGKDDHDTAAEEATRWLNRMRARYRVGFWIEHHMPKGDNGAKHKASPFGSSIWERWPSYGRVITHLDGPYYEFTPDFRADREGGREFPLALVRNKGPLPWMPIWDPDEWEAIKSERAPKNRREY